MDCYIEFSPKDDETLGRLTEFCATLKAVKESAEIVDEEGLIAQLNDAERSYFWNPSPEELAEWNDEWFSTPLPERHSDDRLVPQWTLGSMLESIQNGDYELVGVAREGERHFLAFNPHGHPYGGTGSLVALVECFGHRVIGVDDGIGYADHVARTEYWKPRAKRGL